ncbi:unnamed protein product [Auanema sp. JU1783]|nr:unnamed protein product [Auanema sp. JU1783]
MKQAAEPDEEPPRKRPVLKPTPYFIPGPQEPLPGRSHQGNYWPVFPFHNQFSGGLDLDPSISRHIGGDLNIAVPSWGILDIYGRWFNRIHDTTTKFGYMAQPVNMMDLEREDFVKLMSDPSLHANRNFQPTLPLGKVAKSYTPLNCKPPLCNPYQGSYGFGVEHDVGGHDGVEGDIDVPIPISKGVAYRFPISGKVYYDRDNITITYGSNLSPMDPYSSLFDYQKYRDPGLRIPRAKRDISFSKKVWESESDAKTFSEHLRRGYEPEAELFRSKLTQRPSTYHLMDAGDEKAITISKKELQNIMMDDIEQEKAKLFPNFYPYQFGESAYSYDGLYGDPYELDQPYDVIVSSPVDLDAASGYIDLFKRNYFDNFYRSDLLNPIHYPSTVNSPIPYYAYPFPTSYLPPTPC